MRKTHRTLLVPLLALPVLLVAACDTTVTK